jgi:hypothetical protein
VKRLSNISEVDQLFRLFRSSPRPPMMIGARVRREYVYLTLAAISCLGSRERRGGIVFNLLQDCFHKDEISLCARQKCLRCLRCRPRRPSRRSPEGCQRQDALEVEVARLVAEGEGFIALTRAPCQARNDRRRGEVIGARRCAEAMRGKARTDGEGGGGVRRQGEGFGDEEGSSGGNLSRRKLSICGKHNLGRFTYMWK